MVTTSLRRHVGVSPHRRVARSPCRCVEQWPRHCIDKPLYHLRSTSTQVYIDKASWLRINTSRWLFASLAIDRPVAWWIWRPGYYRIDGPATLLIHADSQPASRPARRTWRSARVARSPPSRTAMKEAAAGRELAGGCPVMPAPEAGPVRRAHPVASPASSVGPSPAASRHHATWSQSCCSPTTLRDISRSVVDHCPRSHHAQRPPQVSDVAGAGTDPRRPIFHL
jgi:hypothetical protein